MLKTHANPEAAPLTTQEIAQAIASLEARSASHANAASQTVTVSEVIQHLGLDMTAEDVLAEVQAQRLWRGVMQMVRPVPKKRTAAILAGIAFVLSFGIWQLNAPPHRDSSPAPFQDIVRAVCFLEPSHLTIAPNAPVLDPTGGIITIRTLAEIPNGRPVWCALTTTGFGAVSGTLWTLTKYDGRVYVRCWTAPISAQAMQQVSKDAPLTLCADRNEADGNIHATVPLTFALNNITLQQSNFLHDDDQLIACHVSLDSHAHEKWQP